MKTFEKLLKQERGAEVIEYLIVFLALAIAFVWAGSAFQRAGETRGDKSMSAQREMVACDPALPLDDTGAEISADSCK